MLAAAAVSGGQVKRAVESDAALQRLGAVSELAGWYSSDDPARRLAATPLLERLGLDPRQATARIEEIERLEAEGIQTITGGGL